MNVIDDDITADGGVCGRRLQADAARPAAALRQTEGQREEPQTLRAARRARVQPSKSLGAQVVVVVVKG